MGNLLASAGVKNPPESWRISYWSRCVRLLRWRCHPASHGPCAHAVTWEYWAYDSCTVAAPSYPWCWCWSPWALLPLPVIGGRHCEPLRYL